MRDFARLVAAGLAAIAVAKLAAFGLKKAAGG